jgi:hypothetical protein
MALWVDYFCLFLPIYYCRYLHRLPRYIYNDGPKKWNMYLMKWFDWLYCVFRVRVQTRSHNGDYSPNFFRQTSLLFHKWLAERFNLDDAWIVNVRYKRAPVGNALSSSGTSQLGMFDIQATTKSKYYDHIVLLYLESRRCRYRSITFACWHTSANYISITKGLCTLITYKLLFIALFDDFNLIIRICHSSISQLCFFSVIYLRFIITLVKGMFDLQIDKKKIVFNE